MTDNKLIALMVWPQSPLRRLYGQRFRTCIARLQRLVIQETGRLPMWLHTSLPRFWRVLHTCAKQD
ncbi:hypothetical protein EMIT0P294_10043 [Pseudomonas sp. IT-P294]